MGRPPSSPHTSGERRPGAAIAGNETWPTSQLQRKSGDDFATGAQRSELIGAKPSQLSGLADLSLPSDAFVMFVVAEAEAAAIRAIFHDRGEYSAAVEPLRRFPGITDNTQARMRARTIAGWKPLLPVKRMPKPPGGCSGRPSGLLDAD
jgi:hypothetical protein